MQGGNHKKECNGFIQTIVVCTRRKTTTTNKQAKGTKMKFKVKGLVFVGFAAAILSANAMAAPAATTDANTVTSKAFTEATYQKKVGGGTNANKLVQATEQAGTVSYVEIGDAQTDVVTGGEKVVTGNAVAAALAQNGGTVNNGQLSITVNNTTETFTANQSGNTNFSISGLEETANKLDGTSGNGISNTDASNEGTAYPSAKAVKDYVASEIASQHTTDNSMYQAYSQAPNQISNGDGGWKSLDNVIDQTTASSASAPTTAAVKTYVDSQATSAASGILAQSVTDGDTTHAPSGEAVYEELALKQNANTAVTHTQGTAVGSTTTPVYIDSTGAAQPTTLGTAANANVSTNGVGTGEGNLVTGNQVYEYINTTNNGLTLPEKPSTCTDSTPCALVSDDTDGMAWKPIAQPND